MAPRDKSDAEIRAIVREETKVFKSEGEIRDIAHAAAREDREDNRAWREEVRQTLGEISNISRNGAQASMNSAGALFGVPGFTEGAMPVIQRQIQAISEQTETDRTTNNARHEENQRRLEKLEAGQHRIRRCIAKLTEWVQSSSGFLDTRAGKWLAGGGALVVLNYVGNHLPSWTSIKQHGLAFWHALGK